MASPEQVLTKCQPCAYCGSEAYACPRDIQGHAWCVCCNGCDLRGPTQTSKNEATEEWSMIQRAIEAHLDT